MSISGQDRLLKSIKDFEAILTPDDHSILKTYGCTNAGDVADFVKNIDTRLQKKQKRRKSLQSSTFVRFVQSMQQFSDIVDTCIQSNPEIAALVWGGMKFVLLAFSNYLSYLEKIVDMCESMGRICPQFERFGKLFPKHQELQGAICEFYSIVVDFFREALLFLYSSALKQLAAATFHPFEERFSGVLKSLDIAKEVIEKEIHLSSEQELHIERVNNAQMRDDILDLCLLSRTANDFYRTNAINMDDTARKLKREKVLENISNYPYYSDFSNNLQKRIEGSGQWIYEKLEYKKWTSSTDSSGLWYHAIPGFGKSVLTAGVIDQLMDASMSARTKRHYIAYFFCSYTTPISLLANTILSTILHQLFYYSHDLPRDLANEIESCFETKASSGRVVLADIQRFLTRIIITNQVTNFIIVDGLDECNDKERGTVLRILKQILADAASGAKILISSRSTQDIARALSKFQHVDLGDSNQADIEVFIAQRLQDKELEGQLPELPTKVLEKVKDFLAENAKGLFIWVDLQIEEICKEARPEDIEAILPTLPKDLDELYNRIINRIVRLRHPEVAQQILKWVAYALRPLSLEELKEATAIENPEMTSKANLVKVADLDGLKWLQNCETLLVVHKSNMTIQFAHSTIKEFLESGKATDVSFHLKPDTHIRLAEACVRYYKLPEISEKSPSYQQTAIAKKNLNALNSLVGSSVSGEANWTNWMVGKLYQYTTAPIKILNTVPSGSNTTPIDGAIVRASDSPVVISQKRNFKYMLKAHTLLEYATSNWILHYAEYASHQQFSGYSDDELRMIYALTHDKFEAIRLPWQNFFSSATEYTDKEKLYDLLDWGLEYRIDFVFDLASSVLASRPKEGHEFLTYWLPTDLGIYTNTRFERLCRQGDSGRGDICAWSTVLEAIALDLKSYRFTFPGYPAGRLSKQPSLLSSLLLYACQRGDKLLFDRLEEILCLLCDTRVRGPVDGSKYLQQSSYEAMLKASIASNSLQIVEALQQEVYTTFIREIPVETRFEILLSVTEVGKTEYFRALIRNFELGLVSPKKEKPSILQKAAEIGDEAICRMCLRFNTDLPSRSQCNKLYPLQIAAKHNHLGVIKVMIPFTDQDRSKVDMTAVRTANTALTYAIMNQNVEMVRVLLLAGADFSLTSSRQFTGDHIIEPEEANYPMLQFCTSPNLEIANLFLKTDEELFLQCLNNNKDIVQRLLEPTKVIALGNLPALQVVWKIRDTILRRQLTDSSYETKFKWFLQEAGCIEESD